MLSTLPPSSPEGLLVGGWWGGEEVGDSLYKHILRHAIYLSFYYYTCVLKDASHVGVYSRSLRRLETYSISIRRLYCSRVFLNLQAAVVYSNKLFDVLVENSSYISYALSQAVSKNAA